MGVSLKLANLWRVLREVDLQAIRTTAHTPFEIWLIDEGDGTGQAEAARVLLGGDPRVPHPSLRVTAATDLNASAAGGAGGSTAAVARAGADAGADAGAGATSSALPAAAILLSTRPTARPVLEPALEVLRRGRVPTVVVLLDEQPADDRINSATEHVVTVPALDAGALDRIGAALIGVVPADLRLAIAKQLPPLRPAVFEATIDETAKANASYAFTTGLAEVVPVLTAPLNLGDMVVLTKNQLVMSYRLLLAAGRDGEPRALIGEILGVLGGGILFRQLARQLVGLIPVAGLVPKVAIAYGGTWAIGRAVVLWATEGRQVTGDLVQTLSAEGMQRGRLVATRLVDQAKSRAGLATRRWERLKDYLPLVRRRGRP